MVCGWAVQNALLPLKVFAIPTGPKFPVPQKSFPIFKIPPPHESGVLTFTPTFTPLAPLIRLHPAVLSYFLLKYVTRLMCAIRSTTAVRFVSLPFIVTPWIFAQLCSSISELLPVGKHSNKFPLFAVTLPPPRQ
ncbi:hypothetical protein, unlikely [Trypanosoma congolense IL3000]|uniref:T. congolense-specific, cell surface-expressed gene family n=1 Tax=Trypanosoma congolense (strain IL3000) TaxID=1068625 RepID=F9W5I0_TRYCI|nr:hypothetical protein, unlikely [Trypanosoma congolense IL3000]